MHLDFLAAQFIRAGESPHEARRLAHAKFGGVTQIKESLREQAGFPMLESIVHDIRFGFRYAVRGFKRAPGITAMIAVMLSLGLGTTTAIFGIVSPLFIRSLPYPQAGELLAVAFNNGTPDGYQFWSYPKFEQFSEAQQSFTGLTAYSDIAVVIDNGHRVDRAMGELVSRNYFSVLGLQAVVGRTFLPSDAVESQRYAEVILSHHVWQQRLGGDEHIVGTDVSIDGMPFTVIGIMGPGVRGQSGGTDVWLPMTMAAQLMWDEVLTSSSQWWVRVIGRLRGSVTLTQAQAEAAALGAAVLRSGDPGEWWPFEVRSSTEMMHLRKLKDTKVDPAIGRAAVLFVVAVALVLLSVCANTAGFLVAQAADRHREFGIRLALGAGRGRLLRQLMAESLALALIGGMGAALVARWGIQWVSVRKPWNTVEVWSQYARTFDYFGVEMDHIVLGFNFLVATITVVCCGFVPAWVASRTEINDTLKGGHRSLRRRVGVPGSFRPRSVLVIAQVSVAVLLVIATGMAVRGAARLSAVRLGFESAGVTTMDILTQDRKPLSFYVDLLSRMERLPGVASVAMSLSTPLNGARTADIRVQDATTTAERTLRAGTNTVTPAYFDVHRIRLLHGRQFSDRDRVGTRPVAIVNEAMAALAWPGEAALGQVIGTPYRIDYGPPEGLFEVVGVVESVKYVGIDSPPAPAVYLPAWQPLGSVERVSLGPDSISVRVSIDTASVVGAIRQEVSTLDRSVAIHGAITLNDRVAQATSRHRYRMVALAALAALAVVVAAVGIYGIMATIVAARTREFGLRIALGARQGEVIRSVVAHGIRLSVAGVCVGLLTGFLGTRVLRAVLADVGPVETWAVLVASVILVIVGILGAWSPARRAAGVEPMVVMRGE